MYLDLSLSLTIPHRYRYILVWGLGSFGSWLGNPIVKPQLLFYVSAAAASLSLFTNKPEDKLQIFLSISTLLILITQYWYTYVVRTVGTQCSIMSNY
mmetsp:Transcript_9686/g.12579  ORF Transcript_9686/g.12579 Transcript_9686/m.12579 type:complete len:97 (-) Transcript_9686:827-1117(-)